MYKNAKYQNISLNTRYSNYKNDLSTVSSNQKLDTSTNIFFNTNTDYYQNITEKVKKMNETSTHKLIHGSRNTLLYQR